MRNNIILCFMFLMLIGCESNDLIEKFPDSHESNLNNIYSYIQKNKCYSKKTACLLNDYVIYGGDNIVINTKNNETVIIFEDCDSIQLQNKELKGTFFYQYLFLDAPDLALRKKQNKKIDDILSDVALLTDE